MIRCELAFTKVQSLVDHRDAEATPQQLEAYLATMSPTLWWVQLAMPSPHISLLDSGQDPYPTVK